MLNNLLGVAASLLAIFAPMFTAILKAKSPDSSESKINITTINNYNYNNRNRNKKNSEKALEGIINGIVNNHEKIINYRNVIFLIAVLFSVANFLIALMNYADGFFVAQYITDILEIGRYNIISYFVAFIVPFLGFFFIWYFSLAYYYDFRLRRQLKNFGYLYQRSTLEALQRILIQKYKFSHFSVYPVLTVARLIENSDIRAKNRRRTRASHEELRSFFNNYIFWGALLILGIIHFMFIIAYSSSSSTYPPITKGRSINPS